MNEVGVLMSTVFIAIGVGLLYYARGLSAKAQQSLLWPSTQGVIAHSAVLEQGGGSGIGVVYLIGGFFAVAGLAFLIGSLTGHVHTGN